MPRRNIDKSGVRNSLKPRREPYWGAPVARGLYLGFRRLAHGGNWIARLRNEDGKQVYRSLGAVSPENDYEAAKREAKRWAKAQAAGVESCDVETVADACADYVESLRKAKREAAAADAQRRFARTIDHDPLGKVKLAQLREKHLTAWRERLEAGKFASLPAMRGRPATPKPISPAGFKRTLTALKAALNRAVSKRYVSADRELEWRDVQPERDADGRRDVYLDKAQRRAFLDAMDADLRALAECIALTGCRPGDPAAILRKEYDGRTASVTFRTKTGGRTIPISQAAKALLDRQAKGKLPTAHLFTNGGKPWTPQDWVGPVKDAAASVKLSPETVLYSLRHSWITDAIVGGMDLVTVAKLTGTSLAMIEKHYGHLVEGAAREKLASMVFV